MSHCIDQTVMAIVELRAALMADESLENLDESETEDVDTLEDDIENEFEPKFLPTDH